MTKSEIFIALIEACKNSEGYFTQFSACCKKDPLKFFSKKTLLNEYNSLTDDEKSIFSSKERFFFLLVEYGYKTKENTKKNITNKCLICDNSVDFISFYEGFKNTCCNDCANKLHEHTNIERYGVKSTNSLECVIEKKRSTFIEKFCGYGTQSEIIRNKMRNTNIERYGCEHPTQNPEIQEKMKKSINLKTKERWNEIRGKAKNTYLEKTGYDHPARNPEIKQKIKNTCKELYGVDHQSQRGYKNNENFDNFDMIIDNFTRNGLILLKDLKKYFNIIGNKSKVLKSIIRVLYNKGFSIATRNIKESSFIDDVESRLNTSLIRQFKISGTKFKVDGFDPDSNTVYEFLGDFWHGNLEIFDSDDINKRANKSFKELNNYTFSRLEKIKSLGYNVKYIWENEYEKSGLQNIIDL